MAVSLCLSVPNKLHYALQEKAEQAGVTPTSFIRELLRDHLGQNR